MGARLPGVEWLFTSCEPGSWAPLGRTECTVPVAGRWQPGHCPAVLLPPGLLGEDGRLFCPCAWTACSPAWPWQAVLCTQNSLWCVPLGEPSGAFSPSTLAVRPLHLLASLFCCPSGPPWPLWHGTPAPGPVTLFRVAQPPVVSCRWSPFRLRSWGWPGGLQFPCRSPDLDSAAHGLLLLGSCRAAEHPDPWPCARGGGAVPWRPSFSLSCGPESHHGLSSCSRSLPWHHSRSRPACHLPSHMYSLLVPTSLSPRGHCLRPRFHFCSRASNWRSSLCPLSTSSW